MSDLFVSHIMLIYLLELLAIRCIKIVPVHLRLLQPTCLCTVEPPYLLTFALLFQTVQGVIKSLIEGKEAKNRRAS